MPANLCALNMHPLKCLCAKKIQSSIQANQFNNIYIIRTQTHTINADLINAHFLSVVAYSGMQIVDIRVCLAHNFAYSLTVAVVKFS